MIKDSFGNEIVQDTSPLRYYSFEIYKDGVLIDTERIHTKICGDKGAGWLCKTILDNTIKSSSDNSTITVKDIGIWERVDDANGNMTDEFIKHEEK